MKKIIFSFAFLLALNCSHAALVNTYNKHVLANWLVYVDSDLVKADSNFEKRALPRLKKALLSIEKKLPKFFLDHARSDGLKIFIISPRKVENKAEMFFVPKNHSRWRRNLEKIMDKSIVITDESIFLLNSPNFSYYLIHEFAHYYHLSVLGYSNPFILKKYHAARQVFNYKGTYALNSHSEFFAELSAMFFTREKDLIKLDKDGADLMKYLWGLKVYKSSMSILTEGLSNMPDWDALEKAEENRKIWAFGIVDEKKN